ncbi:MAG: hypothetical protein CME64_02570 [Halobacteriovoraceae bacterium]|nr:hypothetical protein [Halobacteriovoraceae bacterium]|tara:strand:- start:10220 stop:11110 length:891 start_codon:yes stop_codon:yes gene_type:complete
MEGSANSLSISSKLWRFSAISLAIHLTLLFFSVEVELSSNGSNQNRSKNLLVKLVNKSSLSKQVVQTAKSKRENPSKNTKFLGKHNNNFDRETKAKKVGKHKAAGKGSRNAVSRKSSQDSGKKIKKFNFSDLGVSPTVRPKKVGKKQKFKHAQKGLENGQKGQTGLAQSSDYIEEVPLGDFTRLNTQEFKFYGFYHRIRQKLEQFWGAKLQEEMERLYRSGRSIASGRDLLTSLEIKMNAKGEIVNIKLNSTSGVQELDNVAINSFNEAGPFPNPPKNMLKDGIATIKWGFAVTSN